MEKIILAKNEEAWIAFEEAIRNEAMVSTMRSRWEKMSRISTLKRNAEASKKTINRGGK